MSKNDGGPVDVLAVLELPVYRELLDGEVILEGDELLIFGQWKAQWDHVDRNAVGRVWRDGMAVTRRRIDTSKARAAVAELLTVLSETQDALLAYDGHVSNPMYAEGWSDQEGYKAYARANSILDRCQPLAERAKEQP